MGLIFHKQDFSARNRQKRLKKVFITKSDIPFLTGIHVTSFRNGHIHTQRPATDIHFACGFDENIRYIWETWHFDMLNDRNIPRRPENAEATRRGTIPI